jgi:hypothetical protein
MSTIVATCRYLMRRRDGKPLCPRNDEAGCAHYHRRNTLSSPWQNSQVGKA